MNPLRVLVVCLLVLSVKRETMINVLVTHLIVTNISHWESFVRLFSVKSGWRLMTINVIATKCTHRNRYPIMIPICGLLWKYAKGKSTMRTTKWIILNIKGRELWWCNCVFVCVCVCFVCARRGCGCDKPKTKYTSTKEDGGGWGVMVCAQTKAQGFLHGLTLMMNNSREWIRLYAII